MRRSARLAEKRVKIENEPQQESKKKRSNGKISAIATLDNCTMVEAFRFFNYSQLAKKSLVSMRFRNLIQTHRNTLARLFVDRVTMKMSSYSNDPVRFIFNKMLSRGQYNKWVVRNKYSKQIPLEIFKNPGNESSQDELGNYELSAVAIYNNQKSFNETSVLYAHVELNNETWPLFHHFVRLLTDPFIYICSLELKGDIQNDLLRFFAGAMNPDRNRLQCKQLKIDFTDDTQNCIVWIKDHMRCDKLVIDDYNYNIETDSHEKLLDLFLTGAPCTSAICFIYRVPSKVIADFMQKFMGLKNRDECQVVDSIRSNRIGSGVVNVVKRKCAEVQLLIAEDEQYEDDYCTGQVIGFINNDVKKKLTLDKFRGIPLVENVIPAFEFTASGQELTRLGPNLIDQEVDSQGADALYMISNGQNRMRISFHWNNRDYECSIRVYSI